MNNEELVKSYLYRHYGASKYIPKKVQMPSNECMPNGKPDNGMWASPLIKGSYLWKDFCIDEKFEIDSLKKHFDFRLSQKARVLVLNNSTASKYIVEKTIYLIKERLLDMELILTEGWDAIYYDANNIGEYRLEYWDVTSIVIFNPDIVIPVKKWKELIVWTSESLRR